VVLSPFEVTTDKDLGYGAANSLAGGRTDMPLRLIPAAVSVITAEFMNDLALNTVSDSFFWTLNAAPGSLRQQETIFGDYSYSFRGTGTGGTVPTRNYFQYYAVSDTYNVERFEFARGPNSIVYGDAQLGGQPTTWTKLPRYDREIRSGQFRADSYGGYRTSFDVNQRMGAKAAIRVNSVFQRNKDWRDGIKQDRQAVHLAGRYRLGPRTRNPRGVRMEQGDPAHLFDQSCRPILVLDRPRRQLGRFRCDSGRGARCRWRANRQQRTLVLRCRTGHARGRTFSRLEKLFHVLRHRCRAHGDTARGHPGSPSPAEPAFHAPASRRHCL
jgi:outer membrane receptor protein involved in Fe transport